MKISQIKAGMRGITVVGEVISISNVREVLTRYGPAKLAVAVIRDDTGSIKLNLWRKQITLVKVGDKIIFSKYAGTEIELEGEEYLILQEDEILGILES